MVKVVINDVKTGKSYQKEVDMNIFSGKKLGDKFSGDSLGLKGYEFEITGGSDSAGFPLSKSFESPVRKKILIHGKKGILSKKNVRGNQFGSYISQISLKVLKYGSGDLAKLVGVEKKESEEEKPKETKPAVKEEKKPVEKPKEEIKKVEEKPVEKPKEEPKKKE